MMGLIKAATKLDRPMVQVHTNVPVLGSVARTSTKYRENINVIMMADQAEFAQSYKDHANLRAGVPIELLDVRIISPERIVVYVSQY